MPTKKTAVATTAPLVPLDLTVEQRNLDRALRLVDRAVPARTTLPALGHVLLDATPGRLTLTATDLSLTLMAAVEADVARPGRALLPAQLLAGYASQLPATPVHLAGDAGHDRVRARCGRATATFAALDPEGFPAVPAPDMATAIDLDARSLRRALARVVPAAARDERRPVLGAVLFALGAGGLTLAAADGFRLARAHLPAPGDDRQALVPARAAAEAMRLVGEADAARLVLPPDGRGLWLVAGAAGLHTRLIEGRFPDVAALIPAGWRTRVTVERAALRTALRQAALFGPDGPDARPVVLSAAPGRLRLGAWGAESGAVRSEIAAHLEGAPGMTALDTRLLADLLASAEGTRLSLRWDGPEGAVVVREAGVAPAGDEAEGADLWLVMPLHEAQLLRRQAAADAAADAEAAAEAAAAHAAAA